MAKNSKRHKRRQRHAIREAKMDPMLANAICDDLPDGAYFAMMEELTGLEPGDLAQIDWNGEDGRHV